MNIQGAAVEYPRRLVISHGFRIGFKFYIGRSPDVLNWPDRRKPGQRLCLPASPVSERKRKRNEKQIKDVFKSEWIIQAAVEYRRRLVISHAFAQVLHNFCIGRPPDVLNWPDRRKPGHRRCLPARPVSERRQTWTKKDFRIYLILIEYSRRGGWVSKAPCEFRIVFAYFSHTFRIGFASVLHW